jgi:DNA-directed RNA polymerase specialized sigma24 family protein
LPHREIQSLYCAHHGWPCGWRRKKIGCGHHAAHVAQETFVRIIASRAALLAMREPRACLTTTAKRLPVERARRSSSHPPADAPC